MDLRMNNNLTIKLTVCIGYKKFKELQGVRRYRRYLLNEQVLLRPLYDWYMVGANLQEIDSVMLNITRLKGNQENWTYNEKI
jgi:hypothetical protein